MCLLWPTLTIPNHLFMYRTQGGLYLKRSFYILNETTILRPHTAYLKHDALCLISHKMTYFVILFHSDDSDILRKGCARI